ncbi:MAG: Ribonuclease E inhibitor RraA [uncultured Paraburkholderia sp.]|nr:MAG: Ribonuclease E inhibitor RraA [uncultured Paraburkholderia sp.]CAH2912717.1 MAG: Ribonuclease E inhibitor RraA [uncultured Paraburkholderia sp.]
MQPPTCATEDQLALGTLRVMEPVFHLFSRSECFSGEAVKLRVFEDNGLVRTVLEEKGAGRLLRQIDAGGSLHCALAGANLSQQAEQNGWAGILLNGCVRDTLELNEINVGVAAIATNPRRCQRVGSGERDVAVQMPGALVHPGEWIYADSDDVLVASAALK